MKKSHVLTLVSALFVLMFAGIASAQGSVPDPFSSLGNLFTKVFDMILGIFNLGFLKGSLTNLVALMRFLIWIMLFTIFNFAAKAVFAKAQTGTGATNRIPIVISFCLASITAIFLPASVLIAIGDEYATAIALIMLATMPLAGIYVAYGLMKATTWVHHFIRLVLLVLAWYLLYLVDQGIAGGFHIILFIPALLPKLLKGGEAK